MYAVGAESVSPETPKARLWPGFCIKKRCLKLHAFRNFDSQQTHRQFHYLAYVLAQCQTEYLHGFVFFTQDAEVVVELVVFLHQVVRIVCQDRRVVVCSGLCHYVGKVGQHLDEALFLGAQFDAIPSD